MPKIKITKIVLKEFKKIEELDLELAPITALIGGNTSGKSSVLQGAQLCVSLLQAAFRRWNRLGNAEFAGSISDEDVAFHPTERLLELKRGSRATQTRGFTIGFTCSIKEDEHEPEEREFSLLVKRGKNANIMLSISGDRNLAGQIADHDTPASIFTPGLSGISTREEWRTRGALRAGVMQGDANTFLRSLLSHLYDAPEKWIVFSSLLSEVYLGAVVGIVHNPASDRFVNIHVEYKDQQMPLDLASTGMLQVIQILAYACYFQPLLLLLDEPDSHLHSDSQSLLFEALNQLVETLDTHIVMASHSPQLLQRMTQRENVKVVWMEEGRQVELDANQRPAVPVLMSLGALGFGVDVFSNDKTVILLTEDKKTELVKLYAEANGADNSLAILSYNGCSNLSGARQLAALLRDMRPETKVIIHRDRDFRTEAELEFERLRFQSWLTSDGLGGIEEVFTSGNDIEHKFCSIEHLRQCFNTIDLEVLQRYIDDTIAHKSHDLVEKLTQARQTIQINVYDPPRLSQNSKWAEAGMPDRAPSPKSLRLAEGGDVFPFSQCHGKELEKALRQKIADEIGGDFNLIISALHSASSGLEDPRWQGKF